MTPTLPGSLPGLLRIGSPVKRIYINPTLSRKFTVHSVVLHIDGDTCEVADLDGEVVEVALDTVSLDLTDPTGRIHALWWVQTKEPADSVRLGCDPLRLSLALSSIRRGAELTASEQWEFALYCEDHAGAPDV